MPRAYPLLQVDLFHASRLCIRYSAGKRKGGVAAEWETTWNECPSLSSCSKLTTSSFEECLRAGEGKLREEIKRLHNELQQSTVCVLTTVCLCLSPRLGFGRHSGPSSRVGVGR